MKKSALLVAASAALTGNALAQSNVTVYGIADASVRYLTNANAANNSRISMENGAITNSRLGFRGTEDLGGGTKALFHMAGNLSLDTGAQGGGRLFSRMAFVGLQGNLGTLTFGRQPTPMFDLLVFKFDPLTVGNYNENSWMPIALTTGGRADNMIKYTGTFNGLSVGASYSLGVDSTRTGVNGFSGEIPGSGSRGSQYGLSLAYAAGPFGVGGAFQQTRDNSGNKMTVYNLNASYETGPVKAFAGYLNSKDNTGFVDNILYAFGGKTAAFTPAKGTNRRDDGIFAGLTYRATPALALTAAAYHDRSRNAAANLTSTVLDDGKRYTLVGLAEYSLSKRTQLYTTVDYNKATRAASLDLPGKNNQTGVAVGVRHAF